MYSILILIIKCFSSLVHPKFTDATWHVSCYRRTVDERKFERLQRRAENGFIGRGRKRKGSDITANATGTFTRSKIKPYKADSCFFCTKKYIRHRRQPLHRVQSAGAISSLYKAVEIEANPNLVMRLNTLKTVFGSSTPCVHYHKDCWRRHVFYTLRETLTKVDEEKQEPEVMKDSVCPERFERDYEPITIHEKSNMNLRSGSFMDKTVDEENETENFCNAADTRRNLQMLNDSAKFVRRCISSFNTNMANKREGRLVVCSDINDVPSELYLLIHGIMIGTRQIQSSDKSSKAERDALTICQNIMFGTKSNKQVSGNVVPEQVDFRTSVKKENPQVIGLSLAIHHDTRSKATVDLLHAQNYCLDYKRIIRLETSLANAVIRNMQQFEGLYVPPTVKKGAFIYFAVDNIDFNEDTPDGKCTTHGTITTVFQTATADGDYLAPPLQIDETRDPILLPHQTKVITCQKPQQKCPRKESKQKYEVNKKGIDETYHMSQFSWVLATAISRSGDANVLLPGWSGYNSLVLKSMPQTNVSVLPVLPEVAHEWSTMLTVIMQAKGLNDKVTGGKHPTVITFDMALYEKAVQLVDSRSDLRGNVVPRLGELHVVMAALRGLGSSIENSGIDDVWAEADVFGPATTRQILKCSHYKRCIRAHIYSYVALYEIALEQFFQEHPDILAACSHATGTIVEAYTSRKINGSGTSMPEAHEKFLRVIEEQGVIQRFRRWEEERSQRPMFKSLMNYLRRVESILYFIAATRTADLHLHLQAGEELSKIFFSMDRIKYKRLWPRYLADMKELQQKFPDTWEELKNGGLSVTKNVVPFTSVGPDHATEQEIGVTKNSSSLIGISNQANARDRYFLCAPVLRRYTSDFKRQFGIQTEESSPEHHDLQMHVIKRDHNAINKIKRTILNHGNPFDVQENILCNIITGACIPQGLVESIIHIDDAGQKLFEEYVESRINGSTDLWAPVKKVKNTMYMTTNVKRAVRVRDQVVDLKETKDLYGRLMVLARSSRDVNQKDAIGKYEFTVTPRALFAPDGTMLPCVDKSKLIGALQKNCQANVCLGDSQSEGIEIPSAPCVETGSKVSDESPTNESYGMDIEESSQGLNSNIASEIKSGVSIDSRQTSPVKVAIVDGMVVVQQMASSAKSIDTVAQFGYEFNKRVCNLTGTFQELIIVFDTYKPDSLKNSTRERRRSGKDPVKYRVNDETRIKHITLRRFLSHDQTKADLTLFLAGKIIDYNLSSSQRVVVSAGGKTWSNCGLTFKDNNHEEADTLMIHHGILAAKRHPSDANLTIFSPDTDVLVLAVSNYEQLFHNTTMSMTSHTLQIKEIWKSLGKQRSRALPSVHAFSGADCVGRFAKVGKIKWFHKFLQASDDVMKAFLALSENHAISDEVVSSLAEFVCAVYCPKGVNITNIADLRWHLFCRNMAESDRLPPTFEALRQHILRAHVQARVWGQCHMSKQVFVDPLQNGFLKTSDGTIKPVTTNILPAPQAIIEMVRCHCKGVCTSHRCSCKAKKLQCTDICACGSLCQNTESEFQIGEESDEEEHN